MRSISSMCGVILAVALAGACSDDTSGSVDSAVDTEAPDLGVDLVGGDGLGADAAVDGPIAADSWDGPAPVGDGGGACKAEIAALAAQLNKPGEGCTVSVRLDHETLALRGYQVFCGKYAKPSEDDARKTAQADSGYGAGGQMLNPASPEDEYVFYVAPGDFGGAAAVSADTGLTVFGGSIVWNGAGDITYPTSWKPAAELGSGCPKKGGIPSSRGYDLVNGQPLVKTDVDKALAVALQTAVPAAIWSGGYVFDAVVLRYPRSVGMFNPATAEWIVLVNGGWLE